MSKAYLKKTSTVPENLKPVFAPMYAVMGDLKQAESVDKIIGIFRENKPCNIRQVETIGIMKTSIVKDSYNEIVDCCIIAIDNARENVHAFLNARVLGCDSYNVYFVYHDETYSVSIRNVYFNITVEE